jgi:hypothetical protein
MRQIMADCRIVYAGMTTALEAIATSSTNYREAGEEFIANFKSAINEMEGEAKDELLSFIEGKVNQFTVEDIPGALDNMRGLLEVNLNNFVQVDSQIASSIATSK